LPLKNTFHHQGCKHHGFSLKVNNAVYSRFNYKKIRILAAWVDVWVQFNLVAYTLLRKKNQLHMKTVTPPWKKKMSAKPKLELPGKVAYAILSGVCGTLLLVVFCVAFLNVYQVVNYLPWMIAFNTAMTGFSLIEKTRDRVSHKYLSAVCAGLANVFLTCGILTIVSFYFLGEGLLSGQIFLVLIVIGSAFSALGAWLAVKHFK
jgi:hypothetical protein